VPIALASLTDCCPYGQLSSLPRVTPRSTAAPPHATCHGRSAPQTDKELFKAGKLQVRDTHPVERCRPHVAISPATLRSSNSRKLQLTDAEQKVRMMMLFVLLVLLVLPVLPALVVPLLLELLLLLVLSLLLVTPPLKALDDSAMRSGR